MEPLLFAVGVTGSAAGRPAWSLQGGWFGGQSVAA
jgi:hypothetical protein